MPTPPVENIIVALQTAVGPAILISAVGLLLLTMTNRLGRTIDRARSLAGSDGAQRPDAKNQIDVLLRRADILRWAILCGVASALCASLLVIFLFLATLYGKNFAGLICTLFILCLAALIGSLVLLMWDVNQSLKALRVKVGK